jgi:hypothetical protein
MMEWRFWKWGKKRKHDSPAAVDVARQQASSPPALLTAGSASELLGLQRLIGNQAVLRMMTRNPQSPGASPAGVETH